MPSTLSPPLSRDAFEATADVYDVLTAHHDYEAWVAAIEALARRHGLKRRGTLLDVGCGTGKSFLPWLARGWSVVACDSSPAMLARAEAKAGDRAELLVGDARDLPVLGRFDLVTLIDDVANYMPAGDVRLAFHAIARNLAPDGVFLFDLNTLYAFRSFFGSIDVREDEETVVIWRGLATEEFGPRDVAEATLDAFCATPDGRWERRSTVHREHHHRLADVVGWLADAGLEAVAVSGQGYDGRFEDGVDELRHTKALVVARHA